MQDMDTPKRRTRSILIAQETGNRLDQLIRILNSTWPADRPRLTLGDAVQISISEALQSRGHIGTPNPVSTPVTSTTL